MPQNDRSNFLESRGSKSSKYKMIQFLAKYYQKSCKNDRSNFLQSKGSKNS